MVKLEEMQKTIRIDMGVRNREKERILGFYEAMNVTVGNTLFKKRATHLVTNEPMVHQKVRQIVVW